MSLINNNLINQSNDNIIVIQAIGKACLCVSGSTETLSLNVNVKRQTGHPDKQINTNLDENEGRNR